MAVAASDRGALGAAAEPDEEPAPRLILGLRASAMVELVVFFAAAFAVDLLLLDGTRFRGVAPHPFWIPVVFLSVQYGTGEGLMAAIAAIVALYAGNLPEQGLTEDVYAYLYKVSITPLLWLIAAVVIGELRARQLTERAGLRAELRELRQRNDLIATAYHRLKDERARLESRVAGQLRTVFTTYEAAKAIEKLTVAEVIEGIPPLVRAILNPSRFSIYLLRDGVLKAAYTEGWRSDDRFERAFAPSTSIYQAIVGRHALLCAARAADEAELSGEGLLAGALKGQDSGEVIGMLKVESLPFMELHVHSVESFEILCEWIGVALARARRYERAASGGIFDADQLLFSEGVFARQTQFLASLGRRVGFESSILQVRPAPREPLDRGDREALSRAIGQATAEALRQVDLAFEPNLATGSFRVLLAGTPTAQARVAADKLEGALRRYLPDHLRDLPVDYSVQPLEGSRAAPDG